MVRGGQEAGERRGTAHVGVGLGVIVQPRADLGREVRVITSGLTQRVVDDALPHDVVDREGEGLHGDGQPSGGDSRRAGRS